MRKRWYIVVMVLLLATNGVTLGLLIQRLGGPAKLPDSGKAWEAFTLNGQSKYWQVEDFKIIRTASGIFRGNGNLRYIGNPDHFKPYDYFGYAFFERPGEGSPKPVMSYAETSKGGTIDIPAAAWHIGSIKGTVSDWELAETQADLSLSHMEVSWKDNGGMLHQELIPMSVTEAYSSME
ncbi:hypothetical protein RJP21_23345 [Paenibacillus sp. VCA1]|uniref:hypothetical protein n=1 Tax=Paenibacillus sp. VCA1 TaxID=3039148 RepID=UPI00287163B1|nr:hypothetical protein [Paenibacillus sp. VCA1]MDR9856542.1 hypothetical protein [Paenibacillus sp. VCA1]